MSAYPALTSRGTLSTNSLDRSGVVLLGTGSSAYSDNAFQNDKALGARVVSLPDASSLSSVFPSDIPLGDFEGRDAYLNKDSGWAASAKGVERLLGEVRRLGGQVLSGKRVTGTVREGNTENSKTVGVRCEGGEEFRADKVVLAAGAWMASTFPELGLELRCLPTGWVRRSSYISCIC